MSFEAVDGFAPALTSGALNKAILRSSCSRYAIIVSISNVIKDVLPGFVSRVAAWNGTSVRSRNHVALITLLRKG